MTRFEQFDRLIALGYIGMDAYKTRWLAIFREQGFAQSAVVVGLRARNCYGRKHQQRQQSHKAQEKRNYHDRSLARSKLAELVAVVIVEHDVGVAELDH